MDLGSETQKTNVEIRISIVKMPGVPNFRKNGQLWLFRLKFAQKWILGSKFQNSKPRFKISILEILCIPIFRHKGQLWNFGPKFAQKWIFKNPTLGSESTPPIYHTCQFSVKMDSFSFFGLNLGKLSNYVQYFGSNIVEGVAESWVEAEMS